MKTRFSTVTWSGWMQPAPSQPSWRARCAAPSKAREVAEARDAADEPGGLDADGLADGDQVGDRVEQLDAVRRRLDAQLEAVVLDADAHRRDAVARRGDLLDAQQAARRLDGERQPQVAGRRCPARVSSASIRRDESRICAADSALGIDRPSRPGWTAASMSSASRARGHCSPAPAPRRRRGRRAAASPATSLRALAFSAGGTESSRSSTIASAPRSVGLLHEARHVDGQDQRRAAGAEPAMLR